GAAHAHALGGGAAGRQGVARARVGEAARYALRLGASGARPQRVLLPALAARAGGRICGAAGRSPRSLERAGGAAHTRGTALPARGVLQPALADLCARLADAPALGRRARSLTRPPGLLAMGERALAAARPRPLQPLSGGGERCRLRAPLAWRLDAHRCQARRDPERGRALLARPCARTGRRLQLSRSLGLARGGRVQPGGPGQVDVDAVADHGVELAARVLEYEPSRRDPEPVGAVVS